MIRAMGVHCAYGLLILSASLVTIHGYPTLDEHDFNVWEAEEENPNAEGLKLLAYLCENYPALLSIENIDCSSLQTGTNDLQWDESYRPVVRIKREESDTDLEEGSGNAENESVISLDNEESIQDTSNTTQVEEAQKSDPESDPQPDGEVANVEPQPIADEDQPIVDETEQEPGENEGAAQSEAGNVEEQASSNNTEEQKKENDDQETAVVREPLVPVLLQNQENDKETDTGDTSPVSPSVDSQPVENKEFVVSESTPSQIGNVETSPEQEIPRAETTVVPPIQYSVEASSAASQDVSTTPSITTTQQPKESEIVDDEQSGNAVLIKEPKILAPVLIEGSESDKHLSGVATKANVKSQAPDSEQPNTGESATTVTKASKDTTILIVLFVVVIVIGAAAFTHNFIKKRRQKNSENEASNGIRRSLQNLTGNGKNTGDVEQGTEMKPLMKTNINNPVIVKEFSDTKKEPEAH